MNLTLLLETSWELGNGEYRRKILPLPAARHRHSGRPDVLRDALRPDRRGRGDPMAVHGYRPPKSVLVAGGRDGAPFEVEVERPAALRRDPPPVDGQLALA